MLYLMTPEEIERLPAHHLAVELAQLTDTLNELSAAGAHIPDYGLLRSVQKAAASRLDWLNAPAPTRARVMHLPGAEQSRLAA